MNNVGLFIVSYKITTGMMGAPTFNVNLVVSTPDRHINGQGQVTNNSIHPPLEVNTRLKGDYTYMTVMPNNSHILVVLNGYGSPSPIEPIVVENTTLRMVLNEDWATGTANFTFLDANGRWQEVSNATVTKVAINEAIPASPAAAVAQN